MYLFSAIKDVLFSGRRSSVGGQSPRFSEHRPMRRASSGAVLVNQSQDMDVDRDEKLGSKSKRAESPQSEGMDQEPKRRRTLGSADREIGFPSRLSIDRTDAPTLSSRSRLPSPLPRHSLPGSLAVTRGGILGSPGPVAPSPRSFSRPQTPTHQPKFVDLLRKDPSQQRALESARSILDTLDRVTATAGPVGGSARKYKPPQPLRPMRFKSMSSSRPVSLHDMLSGAVSSVPPSPQAPAVQKLSPVSIPAVGSESPRNGLALPVGALLGSAPSPKRTLNTQTTVPESPKRVLLSAPPAREPSPLKRQPSPLKKPAAPPPGTFVWGDPSKVSDADFIDDDGFAPGADDSESDASPKKQGGGKEVASIFGSTSSSIFGTSAKQPEGGPSIFGGPTTTSGQSIFGSSQSGAPSSGIKPSTEPPAATSGSIFGGAASAAKPPATEPTVSIFIKPATESTGVSGSIFGAASAKPATETSSSIFGSSKPATESTAVSGSIFGSTKPATESTAASGSIFGSAKPSTDSSAASGSIFGSTNPSTESTALSGSIFGSTNPSTESSAMSGSIFGSSKPATESTAVSGSIFGSSKPATESTAVSGSIFGASKPATESTAVSGSMFGSTQPVTEATTTSGSIFGSSTAKPAAADVFGTAQTSSTANSIFGSAAAKPATDGSVFGSSTTPAGSMFGSSTTTGGSMFGSSTAAKPLPESTSTGGSMFGSTSATGGSIFGSSAASQPLPSSKKPEPLSLFGSTSADTVTFGGATSSSGGPSSFASAGIFGGTQAQTAVAGGTPKSGGMFVFGATPPASPHTNVFGSSQQSSTTANVFGGPAAQQPGTPSNSLFGAAAAPTPTGNSIFGGGMFNSAGSGVTDQSSSSFSFGASAAGNVGTPTAGDNPFAANAGDFGGQKRKILKAARRT